MKEVPKEMYQSTSESRVEGGPGFIPLGIKSYNGFPINSWRIESFLAATEAALKGPITEEEARLLRAGCREAAHSSNRVELEESVKVFSPAMKAVYDLLGKDKFMELYSAAPQEEVISYLIDGGYRGDLKYWPDTSQADEAFRKVRLAEITEQVINGRLEWQDRFAEAGVPTPAEYMTERQAEAEEKEARLRELGLTAMS